MKPQDEVENFINISKALGKRQEHFNDLLNLTNGLLNLVNDLHNQTNYLLNLTNSAMDLALQRLEEHPNDPKYPTALAALEKFKDDLVENQMIEKGFSDELSQMFGITVGEPNPNCGDIDVREA